MTQLSEHVIAILRAIADGKRIERDVSCMWIDVPHDVALNFITNGCDGNLRIAPETRTINGVTFAAPSDRDTENYVAVVDGYGMTRYFYFEDEKDSDAACQAIIDALEGRTK